MQIPQILFIILLGQILKYLWPCSAKGTDTQHGRTILIFDHYCFFFLLCWHCFSVAIQQTSLFRCFSVFGLEQIVPKIILCSTTERKKKKKKNHYLLKGFWNAVFEKGFWNAVMPVKECEMQYARMKKQYTHALSTQLRAVIRQGLHFSMTQLQHSEGLHSLLTQRQHLILHLLIGLH